MQTITWQETKAVLCKLRGTAKFTASELAEAKDLFKSDKVHFSTPESLARAIYFEMEESAR